MPPVDPVEDPIIEKQGEVPAAEPTPMDFMCAPGFQELKGGDRRWWKSYLLGRPASSPPMTWDQITCLFLERYIPPSHREDLRFQFEHLLQGTDYEARFSELSRHAIMILPTDAERVWRFVVGLQLGINSNMAREVEMGTSYGLVVEIARKIQCGSSGTSDSITTQLV
ncbi:uncharacterized protein [Nicotiana tomentosiformis]|uniref:uncharacterized protein n=1 Tax=Nicotiana tomentosiformis TaxID=4098 RepID=UPI00388CA093